MHGDPGAALVEELDALNTALTSVPEHQFDRVTNCPPWTIKELIAHVEATTRPPDRWPAGKGEARPVAEYYRRDERATTEYHDANVRRAQVQAEAFADGRALLTRLAETSELIRSRLLSDDRHFVVEVPRVGPMRLADYLATRVIGVAAHGLDLAITLQRPPWTTPEALVVCRTVLLDLLGQDLPVGLKWTDADLLAYSTGRAKPGSEDTQRLGVLGSRLPLIS